jgi:hypothetical protein
VRLTDANDWGSGFVGNLDITNNGAGALTGWTLAFSWPTAWQALGSGWNATWTQTGATVRVTEGAALPAGGSASVGFVASYTGPNVLPGVFTLNGTLCSTG